MAKKVKPNIVMSKESFEDFIWMSYRYCVGRKTIAACSHADTIASVIASNPGIISPERMEFNARDIRSEINRCISFHDNIKFDTFVDDKDVFSPLLYELSNYDDRNNFVFHFDPHSLKFSKVDPVETPVASYKCIENDYSDLIPWVKLSNWMDKSLHRKLIVEYNGKVDEIICYPFPRQIIVDNKYKYVQSWARAEMPDRISMCTWIADEYIKRIEEV